MLHTAPPPTPAREAPPRGDSPLQVPLAPPCPPPSPVSLCPDQRAGRGGRARDPPPPHPRYESTRGAGPALSLRSLVFLAVSAGRIPTLLASKAPPTPAALGAPPDRREGRELPEETSEAPRPHCLQVSERGRLRPPPTPSPGRPIILQSGAPALPLKMDMDRPQSPAWARGGRRRSALRARRPRAVAGLLILQRLSWGPHVASAAAAVAPGPSCCRQSLRTQRPVSVTSSGRKASPLSSRAGSPPTRRTCRAASIPSCCLPRPGCPAAGPERAPGRAPC